MQTEIKKLPNNAFEIKVTVPQSDVDKYYEEALAHEAENVEVKGFRKGKAPLDVVKQNVDPTKLRSHALNHMLPNYYSQIVSENHLKPIIQPRFDIDAFDQGKEMKFTMIIVEKPEIKLNDYKSAVKKLKKPVTNQQIVDVLLETCEIGVADILVDEETNRMMSSLIDQTAKLGITVDQYLQSINKTPEVIRNEYKKSAENTLKADFILTEISILDNITVTDEDLDKTISQIPDEKSREALSQPDQKLYIKAILTKNKTLQVLAEMAQETDKSEDKKQDKPEVETQKDTAKPKKSKTVKKEKK